MPMSQPTARRTAARTASLTSLLCVSGPLLLASTQAQAIPSFARQTGSSCADCHVGSYGPSLTPYGMRFKLGGFYRYRWRRHQDSGVRSAHLVAQQP